MNVLKTLKNLLINSYWIFTNTKTKIKIKMIF